MAEQDEKQPAQEPDTQSDPHGGTASRPGGVSVQEPSRRWWHWRQLLHGRWRPAIAAGVSGAMVAAGSVAWADRTFPFASDARPCWGSLTSADMAGLTRGQRFTAQEISPADDVYDSKGVEGLCRLTVYRGGDSVSEVDIRVHRLDAVALNTPRLMGPDLWWTDQFLSANLVPLGGNLEGMSSAHRAWVALPASCVGNTLDNGIDGGTVADVSMGVPDDVIDEDHSLSKRRSQDRDLLARVAVHIANHAMATIGCKDTLPEPSRLPAFPTYALVQPNSVCGIRGLALPSDWQDEVKNMQMLINSAGSVRTCELGTPGLPEVRLTTVAYPNLLPMFANRRDVGGTEVDGTGGYALVGPNTSAFFAHCGDHRVVFLAQDTPTSDTPELPKALLPGWVAAEGQRLGCGPLAVKL